MDLCNEQRPFKASQLRSSQNSKIKSLPPSSMYCVLPNQNISFCNTWSGTKTKQPRKISLGVEHHLNFHIQGISD